jgi:hypothetical protein
MQPLIKICLCLVTLVTITAASVIPTNAGEDKAATDKAAELAKKLANPIASLISVPAQYNDDEYGGLNDGASVSRLNLQPVIPFSLTDNWNVITRTIVPLIDQHGFPLEAMNESGPGDIVASHIWSVAGDDDRADINATFMQPFVSYRTKTKTTFGLVTESTHDWKNEAWSVPVIAQVSQMFKIGPQIPQFSVGVRAKYWAESPDNGPDGWSSRTQLTFLFPK